eukprot:1150889-Pelagomonas_calceolata.AAC.7
MQAMMTGDTKWGSHPELMSIFSDSAVLIGHDGQRYEGRAAIIRRLNTGMEQFLQMMGFREDVSEEARRDMAARASQARDPRPFVVVTWCKGTWLAHAAKM